MALAEIFITFEVLTFLLFLKGVDEGKIMFPLLAMGFFFGLGVAAFSVNAIFTGTAVTSWLAVSINFGLGLMSFLYSMFMYMDVMRKGLTEGEVEV